VREAHLAHAAARTRRQQAQVLAIFSSARASRPELGGDGGEIVAVLQRIRGVRVRQQRAAD
jgi:hypothetical protein